MARTMILVAGTPNSAAATVIASSMLGASTGPSRAALAPPTRYAIQVRGFEGAGRRALITGVL